MKMVLLSPDALRRLNTSVKDNEVDTIESNMNKILHTPELEDRTKSSVPNWGICVANLMLIFSPFQQALHVYRLICIQPRFYFWPFLLMVIIE